MSQQSYRQFGVSAIPLSKVIKTFCVEQGNEKASYFTKMAVHAKWAWRDLYVNTIFDYRSIILPVCAPDYTIQIPDDCERLFNVSIIDRHGKIHPLGLNTNINTAKILCPTVKCSCNECKGQNTLCAAIDTLSVATKTIMIEGNPYTQTTWVSYDRDGSIREATEIPGLNTQTNEVEYTKFYKTLCNVEVTDKGCIKPTSANRELLSGFCGFSNEFWGRWHQEEKEIIPISYNWYGQWNWDAVCGDIIHIFGHQRWREGHPKESEHFHQFENSIRQVLLTYQTNGQTPETEVLVPEYAVVALLAGILHRQTILSMRAPVSVKEYNRVNYNREKKSLYSYLNPIRIDDVRKMQAMPILW